MSGIRENTQDTIRKKYKELQPEKYAGTVSGDRKGRYACRYAYFHLRKGDFGFPADSARVKGIGCYVRYGGHTLEMLKCLNGQGHICALDVDPIESAKDQRTSGKAGIRAGDTHRKTSEFCRLLICCKRRRDCSILSLPDLMSSMQIDNPERGFSYKNEGPLDLRLNRWRYQSLTRRLKTAGQEELKGMP